jgi:hypothetical protein
LAGSTVKVSILTNTANRYNRRHPDVGETIRAALPGALYRDTRGIAEIEPALAEIADAGTELLVLNGGDGTVQKVVTALLARSAQYTPPMLALLPGGTTNMTARSINAQALGFQRALRALSDLVPGLAVGHPAVIERPAVVATLPDHTQVAGFFWGMGAILRGIEYCQKTVYEAGIGGEQASGVALVRTVIGIARRQPPFAGGATVELAGCTPSGRFEASILLATTLEQLFLGIRPFWGEPQGALRGVLVEEPARRLIRNLPALLRGRPNRHMTAATGYHPINTETLEVTAAGRFTLDGELYDLPAGTLRLAPSIPLRFLRLGAP